MKIFLIIRDGTILSFEADTAPGDYFDNLLMNE